MRASVTRAGAYAGISLLALAATVFDGFALAGFALVAIVSSVLDRGQIFELFADPAERRTGRLVGLTEFAAVAAVIAAATVLGVVSVELYVGAVLLVGFGYLLAEMAKTARPDRLTETVGFITGGFVGFAGGSLASVSDPASAAPLVGFLAMAGALAAALIRAATWARHDGLIMLLVVGLASVLATTPAPSPETVAFAIGISIVLAYLALLIGAASVPGVVTGVLAVFLTIVLGGIVWVSLLVAFFGIGGLTTKYRYEEKRRRGVAEPNRGARGTGNVLGNTAVGLVAVIAVASIDPGASLERALLFAFAGSMATALSDTLSSEIGGLYDDPWMITSFDRVTPGTDGAITFQGTVAGAVGAGIIALMLLALADGIGPAGGLVVLVAGTVGMFVDSILGALFEGRVVGNHSVNAMATLSGAIIAASVPLLGL
ncbi:MAG: DUF92 domain-containing protein [Halobacteriales archaeon]